MVDLKKTTSGVKKFFGEKFKSVKHAFKAGWNKVKHLGKKEPAPAATVPSS